MSTTTDSTASPVEAVLAHRSPVVLAPRSPAVLAQGSPVAAALAYEGKSTKDSTESYGEIPLERESLYGSIWYPVNFVFVVVGFVSLCLEAGREFFSGVGIWEVEIQ